MNDLAIIRGGDDRGKTKHIQRSCAAHMIHNLNHTRVAGSSYECQMLPHGHKHYECVVCSSHKNWTQHSCTFRRSLLNPEFHKRKFPNDNVLNRTRMIINGETKARGKDRNDAKDKCQTCQYSQVIGLRCWQNLLLRRSVFFRTFLQDFNASPLYACPYCGEAEGVDTHLTERPHVQS